MKVYLVGILNDKGKVDHLRSFFSETWRDKYAKSAGDAARYAEVEVEFSVTPPISDDTESQ